MTQNYIVGELSLLLARLQAVAPDQSLRGEFTHLRHLAEFGSPAGLGSVVLQALTTSDSLCWASLEQGDRASFTAQATTASELRGFAECAGLLDDDPG